MCCFTLFWINLLIPEGSCHKVRAVKPANYRLSDPQQSHQSNATQEPQTAVLGRTYCKKQDNTTTLLFLLLLLLSSITSPLTTICGVLHVDAHSFYVAFRVTQIIQAMRGLRIRILKSGTSETSFYLLQYSRTFPDNNCPFWPPKRIEYVRVLFLSMSLDHSSVRTH